MTRIHYFQRYSQKENVVTNNTLLLLSRFYVHSPRKLEDIINGLLDDPQISVGVTFLQQKPTSASVLDGLLFQTGFRLAIETKLYQNHDVNQLRRHLEEFAHGKCGRDEKQLLVSLSPAPPDIHIESKARELVADFNKEKGTTATFFCTTFEQLIEVCKEQVSDRDYELQDILEEFKDYCAEAGLLPRTDFTMRVVTCGWTLNENLEFNLYYEPVERSARSHKYLGIYRDKCVRALGEVENIISADLSEGVVEVVSSIRPVQAGQKDRIAQVIAKTKATTGWDISRGYRFYLVNRFIDTAFEKQSAGPLRGVRYFDLGRVTGRSSLPSVEEIAVLLKTCKWD